jgi:hypothetical protein
VLVVHRTGTTSFEVSVMVRSLVQRGFVKIAGMCRHSIWFKQIHLNHMVTKSNSPKAYCKLPLVSSVKSHMWIVIIPYVTIMLSNKYSRVK